MSTMSSEGNKDRKQWRQLPESFKADMVALVLDKGMKPGAVIEQFGLPRVSFYRWLKAARIERGEDPGQELTRTERQELNALRKQVRDLKMEAELVKKWAAFFAKESER